MIRKLWLIFAQAVTVSAGIAVGLITVTDWRPFAPAQEAVHLSLIHLSEPTRH